MGLRRASIAAFQDHRRQGARGAAIQRDMGGEGATALRRGPWEVFMRLHGSVLAAAHLRTWLCGIVTVQRFTVKVWAGRTLPWPICVRMGGGSAYPEALAHQVRGVHGRWGLLIGDDNGFYGCLVNSRSRVSIYMPRGALRGHDSSVANFG